jgi:threonine dehydratase
MKPDKKVTGWGGDPVPQPDLSEIQTAAGRLKDVIVRTPLVPLHSYDSKADIFLKPEILQPIGSFKIRGVYNWAACLTAKEQEQGLSTISAGNTAMALGYTARLLGVTARCLLPDGVPESRVNEIRSYGMDAVNLPLDELFDYIFESHWKGEQYSFLNPWGDPKMIAGSGTIGLEIYNDMPNVETVYVPVGGGGLISGVGSALKALKPSVRIVGVQSETCPSLQTSLKAEGSVWIDMEPTICHGTAVPFVVDEMFPMLRKIVDDTVLVSEDDVKATIKRLAIRDKLMVEGSGALPVAAALATPPEKRGKSVCIISGGSLDLEELKEIIAMKE